MTIFSASTVGGSPTNQPVLAAGAQQVALSATQTNFTPGSMPVATSSIQLPMPIQYAAEYGADWTAEATTGLERGVAAGVQAFNSTGRLKDIASAVGRNLYGAAEDELVKFAYNTAYKLAARNQGLAYNPRKELFYSGPKFRTFNFTWNFSFTSQKDANSYDDIVRALLLAMHPDFQISDNAAGSWKIPDTVGIQMINAKVRQPAACVITGLRDNSTASGAGWKAMVIDGQPAHVSLDVSFLELAPLTKTDITAGH